MSVQIELIEGPFKINVKRFYAPFIVRAACPACGRENELDYSEREYLSYPCVGRFTETLYCLDEHGDETDCEPFDIDLVLRLTLEVADDE